MSRRQLIPNKVLPRLQAGATPAASLALTGRHTAEWLVHDLIQVVGVTLAVVVLLAVLAARATWRTLRSRVSYVASPTSSFDPSAEEVGRFAHVLSRVRRAVRGLASRRSETIRFRLTTDERGRVVQYMEGTPRALALVKAGLPVEVELKETKQ